MWKIRKLSLQSGFELMTTRMIDEVLTNPQISCRLCKGADFFDETAEHILCTCDPISLKRLLYLGKANLSPEEVVSVGP